MTNPLMRTTMPIQPGDHAPDATVFRFPRQPVRLSEYRGRRHVILFFPLAFTSTCTQEFCMMADDYAQYRDIDAEVIGLSVDSPYVNQKFAESCHAPFAILSDFNKEASQAFGVLRAGLGELRGVSERAAFVIGEDGIVRYAWIAADLDELPDFETIKQALVS